MIRPLLPAEESDPQSDNKAHTDLRWFSPVRQLLSPPTIDES